MDSSDNGSRKRLHEANKMFENGLKMFENALKMLENENIGKLAKIIFTVDDLWSIDTVNKFDKAHDGFIEYWRDKHHKEFKRRFDALQLAFLCDVFRRLFVDKQLKELKIEEYLSELIECIREKKAEYYGELEHFVTVLHRFTDQPINKIVQKAFFNYRHELKSASEKREDIEEIVVNWLIDFQTEDSLLQQPLIIICKPMALAESIIKELYRNRFANYNPFHIDLGFQFNMNTWFPIKLVKSKQRRGEEERRLKVFEQEVADDDREDGESDESETNDSETNDDIESDKDEASENESNMDIDLFEIPNQAKTIKSTIFQLIEDELTENRFVVITGNIRNYLNKIMFSGAPGAGKTLLTQKIVFDYATLKSEENKWNKYDLILLSEFRSTSDRKHETIIGMALYGLEKIGLKQNVINFIKENVNKYKILIILDGYDEEDRQQLSIEKRI
jgi:hypothetical protein